MLWWIIGYLLGASVVLGAILAAIPDKKLKERGSAFAVLVCMALWPMAVVAVLTMSVVRRID